MLLRRSNFDIFTSFIFLNLLQLYGHKTSLQSIVLEIGFSFCRKVEIVNVISLVKRIELSNFILIYIFSSIFFLNCLFMSCFQLTLLLLISVLSIHTFSTTIYSFLSFFCFNDAYKSSKVILYSMRRVAFTIITNNLSYSLLVDFHS